MVRSIQSVSERLMHVLMFVTLLILKLLGLKRMLDGIPVVLRGASMLARTWAYL